MSHVANQDTKEKELGTSNSSIKVYIPRSSVLLNLLALNSTKQKSMSSLVSSMLDIAKHDPQSSLYQTEPEKDKYLTSFSPSNQFTTNIKSNDKDNNAVVIIKRLFLNFEYRLSYKKSTEKVIHEICKFFIHSTRYISSKDQVDLCEIRSRLRPFQALGIFLILQIEVDTSSGSILVDKMGYEKIR